MHIYPDFGKIFLEIKKIKEFSFSNDKIVLQNKKLQGILYREINKPKWNADSLLELLREEYLFLNNIDFLKLDWFFQCLFLYQRLKGDFDRRESNYMAKRSMKIIKLQDLLYKEFETGIKINKVKFKRTYSNMQENGESSREKYNVDCLDFSWEIDN